LACTIIIPPCRIIQAVPYPLTIGSPPRGDSARWEVSACNRNTSN